METGSNANNRRILVLRHLYQRLLPIHMDLPDQEEEWSVLTLPKARHVRYLRSDGGQYFPHEFTLYLQDEGIRRVFWCRHIPQQNGVAETEKRVILEVSWVILNEKHMAKYYWAKVACAAIYLMNRLHCARGPRVGIRTCHLVHNRGKCISWTLVQVCGDCPLVLSRIVLETRRIGTKDREEEWG